MARKKITYKQDPLCSRVEELQAELGLLLRERQQLPSTTTPEAAHKAFLQACPSMATSKKEHFVVLFLDGRRKVIGHEVVSIGTLTATLVHPREVFAPALVARASSILVAHNHPSGDPEPSHEDIMLTKRLQEAGRLLGVQVDDHLVLAGAGAFCSMRQKGLIF